MAAVQLIGQRLADGDQQAGAHALQGAPADQRADAVGVARAEGGQHEQRQRQQKHPPSADALRQPGAERDHQRQAENIAVADPRQLADRRPHHLADGGVGDVGDKHIDQIDEKAEQIDDCHFAAIRHGASG